MRYRICLVICAILCGIAPAAGAADLYRVAVESAAATLKPVAESL